MTIGFPTNVDGKYLCKITYNENTKTLSVIPTGRTFDVVVGGTPTTFTKIELTHPASYGKYYFYVNERGVPVVDTQMFDIYKHAPICILFYDGEFSIPSEERHHSGRSLDWHRDVHQNRGTEVISGFDLSGYTLNSGYSDARMKIKIGSGILRDEDIDVTTEEVSTYYNVLRRIGNNWKLTRNHPIPCHTISGVISFNKKVGNMWTDSFVANNHYINYWMVAVPTIPKTAMTPYPPDSLQIIMIPGDKDFFTLEKAQEEKIFEYDWEGLPFDEVVPIGKVIFKYSVEYSNIQNTGNCSIADIQKLSGTSKSFSHLTEMEHHLHDLNPHPQYSYGWEPVIINNGSVDFLTTSDGDIISSRTSGSSI